VYWLTDFVSQTGAFDRVCVPTLTTFVSQLDVSAYANVHSLTTFMSASRLVSDTRVVLGSSDVLFR